MVQSAPFRHNWWNHTPTPHPQLWPSCLDFLVEWRRSSTPRSIWWSNRHLSPMAKNILGAISLRPLETFGSLPKKNLRNRSFWRKLNTERSKIKQDLGSKGGTPWTSPFPEMSTIREPIIQTAAAQLSTFQDRLRVLSARPPGAGHQKAIARRWCHRYVRLPTANPTSGKLT